MLSRAAAHLGRHCPGSTLHAPAFGAQLVAARTGQQEQAPAAASSPVAHMISDARNRARSVDQETREQGEWPRRSPDAPPDPAQRAESPEAKRPIGPDGVKVVKEASGKAAEAMNYNAYEEDLRAREQEASSSRAGASESQNGSQGTGEGGTVAQGDVGSWVRDAVGPGMDVLRHSKERVVEAVSNMFGGKGKNQDLEDKK